MNLLELAQAQIGKLHDGPDVPRIARAIGEKFPRLAKYCAVAENNTAWCGIFIAWLLATEFGIEPPYSGKVDEGSFMYVDSWCDTPWGATRIQPGQEQPGDIICFKSPHHVTIIKEVRGDRYICVGGNQTGPSGNPDSVTQASYSRAGLMAIVRPPQSAQIVTDPPKPAAPFVPLEQAMIDAITRAAAASDLARYTWKERGRAPIGYVKGMAVVYGAVLRKLVAQDSAAIAMVRYVDGPGDVFDHYESQFLAAGIVTANAPAVDRLRALFVVLTGLGMRESSGNYSEGRDMNASNTSADTAEAGLFQMSWNAHTTSPEIPKLLDAYRAKKYPGLVDIFSEGVRAKATDEFGEGDGAEFQFHAKIQPAFAVEAAAIGLRTLYPHWGPIARHEAEVVPAADALFRQVQEIVGVVSPVPTPKPPPTDPPPWVAKPSIPGATMDDKVKLTLITEIVKPMPDTKAMHLMLLDAPVVPAPPVTGGTLPANPPIATPPVAPATDHATNWGAAIAAAIGALGLGGAGVIGTPVGPDMTTAGLISTVGPLVAAGAWPIILRLFPGLAPKPKA